MPGAAGHGRILVEEHAVSLDETRVAASCRTTTRSGSLRSPRTASIRPLQGGDYTSLSWDGYGNLWVVEDLSAEVAEAEREEDLADDTEPATPRWGARSAGKRTAERSAR